MRGIEGRRVHQNLVERLLDGEGRAPGHLRRSAFDNEGLTGTLGNLTEKVAFNAAAITDQDIVTVRQSGLSEDQIFEIVVCAAVGHAARQYESAIDALTVAANEERQP